MSEKRKLWKALDLLFYDCDDGIYYGWKEGISIQDVLKEHPESLSAFMDAWYEPTEGDCSHGEAVKWNPHNEVVQCHKCGQVFVPQTLDSTPRNDKQ